MARGHQKIQSQQKNAKKQAEAKKSKGHDQKAAAKAALVYTCTVCRVWSLCSHYRILWSKHFFFFFFEGIEHGGKISEIIRQPLWLFINWLKWRKLKTLWFQFLILEYVLFYMLLLEHVVWECHVWQPASAFFTPLSFSCQKARASTRLFSSLINLPVMCF